MNFLGVDSLAAEPPLVQPADDSVAAYDAIADEYDSPEHRTTCELGRLSRLAIQEAPIDGVLDRSNALVLELGCGTGFFTSGLAEQMRGGQLLITDPSMRMLRHAASRLAPGANRPHRRISSLAFRASAAEVLSKLATPPDLIAAGLADPYLSESLFRDARRASSTGTHLLVTLPTRQWAVAERTGRLRIPLDRTRFRTREGRTVHSRSLTLDPSELARCFSVNGFRVIAQGAIESQARDWNPTPEIAWALGRPALSPVPDRQRSKSSR